MGDAATMMDDVGRPKPAPDLFLYAARRLDVPPEGARVEDSREGMVAATQASMLAIDMLEVLPFSMRHARAQQTRPGAALLLSAKSMRRDRSREVT